MARTANNQIAQRPQQAQNSANQDFDDRGKKFTQFVNGQAIKNLLSSSLGGPQQAAQLTSTMISVVSANEKLQLAPPMQILSAALRGEIGMGLSLVLGDYAIIPYEDKKKGTVTAQFQLQVNGIKRMCIASGAYDKINCYDVREGEFQGYDPDTWEPIVVRNPDDEERDQLPIVGYYAFYRLNKSYNGFTNKIYWPYEKILRHADRYSKAFDLNIWKQIQAGATSGTDNNGYTWYANSKRSGSPWYGDMTEEGHMKMCRKTVLKQLLSDGFAPKSTLIQAAIAADNASEYSEEPITYADEFDRMAKEAALSLAREQPVPQIEASHNVAAPETAEIQAQAAPASPAPAPAAQQTARRGRPSTKSVQESSGNASQRPAAPAPAPEAPLYQDQPMMPDFHDMTDDDPFADNF